MIQRTPPRDFPLPQLPGSASSSRRTAAARATILALVLALGFASFGLGLAMPLLARASDAPAQDPPPLSPSATQVHLPVLGGVEGATACETWISIQLTGDEPSKAVLITWGAPSLCPPQSAGPLKVECTGLLFPGASWSMLGAQIPTGSQSGTLFSFTAKKLSEVGLAGALGFDDVVADTMCEFLFFGVVGDGDDYRRFKKAYDTGDAFADIPQRIAAGGALAVNVNRECASAADPARKLSLTYSGVPGGSLGSFDPVFGGFGYFLPQVVARRDGLTSHVYLHNAGLECAAVELWFEPRAATPDAACDTPPTRCALLTLPPGERAHVDVAAACAVEGQAGGLRLRSTVPLAVVADTVGGAAAASYTGRADGAPVLLAPLVLGDHADWSTLLHVQNLDLTGEARVQATFLDRSGDVLSTAERSICPGGTASFDLNAAALPEGWIGSARVESLPRPVPGAADRLPPLVGVAELGYRAANGEVHELVQYGLAPLGRAPDGQMVGNPAMGAGAGMLALPAIAKSRGGDAAFTTELVIANTVTQPGFTRLAMYLYDQNGLLDSLCSELQDRQVEYIDLRTWGLVAPGFRGNAVISATSWDHAVFDPSGKRIANPVGLAAVVLDRPLGRTPSGAVIAVDGERAATGYAGIPIALPKDRPFDPDVFRTGCPGDQPRPTRPPTMVPPPTETAIPTEPGTPPPTAVPPPTLATPLVPSATQLHLPILSETDGATACSVAIDIQNVGDDPSKVVLVAWGDPGNCSPQANGPLKVECSGLIAPGTRWTFSENQVPAGARSAAIFSFTGKLLSEVGVDLGFDDVVADLMCEELFFGIVGDADDYRRFKQAFDSGGVYRGIPQFLAAGSPMAAFVNRTCPNPLSATSYNAMYSAVPGSALGSMDPIAGGYAYTMAYAATGRAEESSQVHVQNASEDCASVEIWFRPQPATLDAPCDIPAKRCTTFTVAPGESRAFDVAETCAVGGDPGSVWLRSTSELAAVMDTTDRFAGASVVAGTSGAQNLIAPQIYNEYSGWDTRIHVQNLSTEVEARVKVYFQDRSGDTIASLIAQVCPQSSRAFDLSSVADLPGSWVGSARVEVQPLMGPGGIEVGPDLLGVVQLVQPATADRPSQMIQYNLLPAIPAHVGGAAPFGAALASGAGMVALPAIQKGRDSSRTTEIAIANLVTKPGFTDFALYLYDQNGLLDFVCMKINDHQVEYIDLATWGTLRSGFTGSAVISAVFWEHDVFDPNGMFVANLVGLGAVVVERGEMKIGTGPAITEAGGSEGIPLMGEDAAHFRPLFGATGCQSGPAPVTPRATATGMATPTVEATATVVATPTFEATATIPSTPLPATATPTAPPSATPPESTPTVEPTASRVIPTVTTLPPTATVLPPTPRPTATDVPTTLPSATAPTATVPAVGATATPIAKVCETIRPRVPANVIAEALADPAAISGYNQLQYPNRPPGPFNLRRTWLTLSDVSRPWNRLYNALVFKVGCR